MFPAWLFMLLIPTPLVSAFLCGCRPTAQTQRCQRCVGPERFCQRAHSFIINAVVCERWLRLMRSLFICPSWCCSPSRRSSTSVVFSFRASPSIRAPLVSILFSACSCRVHCCSVCHSIAWRCSRPKSNTISVAFPRSACFSSRAPLVSISVPVFWWRCSRLRSFFVGLCCVFCSLASRSTQSVVFVLSALLSACAPSLLSALPVCALSLLCCFHRSFLLCREQLRSSAVSVVLTRSALLSACAPSPPMPLSACCV